MFRLPATMWQRQQRKMIHRLTIYGLPDCDTSCLK